MSDFNFDFDDFVIDPEEISGEASTEELWDTGQPMDVFSSGQPQDIFNTRD